MENKFVTEDLLLYGLSADLVRLSSKFFNIMILAWALIFDCVLMFNSFTWGLGAEYACMNVCADIAF